MRITISAPRSEAERRAFTSASEMTDCVVSGSWLHHSHVGISSWSSQYGIDLGPRRLPARRQLGGSNPDEELVLSLGAAEAAM